MQVEDFLGEHVHPYYANVHTDTGECARRTGALFTECRTSFAACLNAPRDEYGVLFVGNGMTGAAALLSNMLGIQRHPDGAAKSTRGKRPTVIYSVLEHHSNCLPWREADVDNVVRCLSFVQRTALCQIIDVSLP